jgi:hypothetical protein
MFPIGFYFGNGYTMFSVFGGALKVMEERCADGTMVTFDTPDDWFVLGRLEAAQGLT